MVKQQTANFTLPNEHTILLGQPSQLAAVSNTCPVCHCSATAAELIDFTLVYVLISTGSAALRRARVCGIKRSPAYLPRPISSRLEQIRRTSFYADAGARCSISAEFSTEQTGRHPPQEQHNIRFIFKIKHSMLTPAQKSKK